MFQTIDVGVGTVSSDSCDSDERDIKRYPLLVHVPLHVHEKEQLTKKTHHGAGKIIIFNVFTKASGLVM